MKAKKFVDTWNQSCPDLHFYLEEVLDGIIEVRIRFRSSKYSVDAVQWQEFQSAVVSRSQRCMVVASGHFNHGAIDVIANPIGDNIGDSFDETVKDTLEYLAEQVFPQLEKNH